MSKPSPPAVMTPVVIVPSPQSIVATNSLANSPPLASTMCATRTFVSAMPSMAVSGLTLVAASRASVTFTRNALVTLWPPSSDTVTEPLNDPSSAYVCVALTNNDEQSIGRQYTLPAPYNTVLAHQNVERARTALHDSGAHRDR